MMNHIVRKKLPSSAISSSSQLTRISPKFTLSASKKRVHSASHSPLLSSYSHSRSFTSSCYDDTNPGLVGWWAGVSDEEKCPYGQLIHISAEQGRYLARSYSPWQLATAKSGTPVFEIYVTTGLQGENKEQAICIKQKEACHHSLGSLERMQLELGVFPLTALGGRSDHDQWVETMMKYATASGSYLDKEAAKNFVARYRLYEQVAWDVGTEVAVDSLEEKTVVHIDFAVGDIVEKVTRTPNKKVLRIPGTLERKDCFSFSLTLEEYKEQPVSDDHNHTVYRTTDHKFLEFADCIGKGIPLQGVMREEDHKKFISLLVSQAKNQQPALSRLTTYKWIDVPASSDPLNGLYIGSNGYLATEVIQVRKLFGPWHEADGIKEVSDPELCEYVEAVNLTGDFDMPAGQVAFRAKVGEKYKLRPGIVLEKRYGAVARYKGKGRHPGFQNFKLVDVDVLVLGEEYRREGFAIAILTEGLAVAVLCSPSEY
ncbi:Protein EXECUTER 1, chloroplastic [Heracleum sosnowskyi]|uniref:Protein EXECUTER 1, chloroplastic n=1 Tax=Heracleum sosnowskyi TaxID=360622 RepID=A0AAD8IKB9_9APIA|nr:Protein EXECUTER 1, chloroplastic [Heracleum sosnowskyi]